jgi:prolipoprotein diacylglyceryltransferase
MYKRHDKFNVSSKQRRESLQNFVYTTQVVRVLSARVMYVQSPWHKLLTKLTVAQLAKKKKILFFWNQNTY